MPLVEKCTSVKKMEGEGEGISLLDIVFSWCIRDILDKNLYKHKVKRIPEVFTSSTRYTTSFKYPLIEETRASLHSEIESVGQCSACEMTKIEPSTSHKLPKDLYYNILTAKISGFNNPGGHYDPGANDFVVLTKNTKPRRPDDLTRNCHDFIFGFVSTMEEGSDMTRIVTSKEIDSDFLTSRCSRVKVFVTCLMNLTTNMRIWRGLHSDSEGSNMKLILKVLKPNIDAGDDCTICSSPASFMLLEDNVVDMIRSFELDEYQKNAILSSIAMRKCTHDEVNVKLIWGPPGTGKTKTIASLLFALRKLKCRTLACAPTNIAILQLAKRLMGLVEHSLEYGNYGYGDIILFGNGKRMKIDDTDDILNVFLDYRAAIISKCRSPWDGWIKTSTSMITLLEDPEKEYRLYLKSNEDSDDEEYENSKEVMDFEEFVRGRFYSIGQRLAFLMKNIYTHLPTAIIKLFVVKKMIKIIDLLKLIGDNKGTLTMKREEFLQVLKTLPEHFEIPVSSFSDIQGIKKFCLMNANLIFCMVSSSANMLTEGMNPVEMVIIDEAAQLKECESMIPFQIPGVRNTILIGDDKQLSAMVQSKVAEDAYFGRSLFERLAKLGQKKHLLNVQYRMHPSISSFPNRKFYHNRILDGMNVKKTSYRRCFLKGEIYGSYSFINVARGKEDFDRGHSPTNLVESSVINEILAKLFREFRLTRKNVSVGVISPYKGQVDLIQGTLGDKYSNENGFTVSVRSVDGFQGGEEDVIIISTVRSNGNGNVGFISNKQRTNVALTRAKYCLWILGNGNTLLNSGSVWRDLVVDAKNRGCFYNAEEDKELDKAMSLLLEDENATFNLDSLKLSLELRKPRWKVVFTDVFKNSMSEIKSVETKKEVVEILNKLADGWRESTPSDAMVISDLASTLLELYKIDEQFSLAWTVDVVKEKSKYTQVIKIWDVLTYCGIRKFVQKFSILIGSYTLDTICRCKHKSFEGNFAVPKTWSIVNNCDDSDSLSGRLSLLNLRGNEGESSSSFSLRGNEGESSSSFRN